MVSNCYVSCEKYLRSMQGMLSKLYFASVKNLIGYFDEEESIEICIFLQELFVICFDFADREYGRYKSGHGNKNQSTG